MRLQLKQPYLRIWAWHTGILSPFNKSLTNHLEKRHTKKELRIEKKIKRPHTKEKCQINQTIIEKSLSVNIGLKCVELNQKSKKEKYTLTTNQGYTVGLKKLHYVLSYMNLLGNITGSPMEDQPILVYITVRPLK